MLYFRDLETGKNKTEFEFLILSHSFLKTPVSVPIFSESTPNPIESTSKLELSSIVSMVCVSEPTPSHSLEFTPNPISVPQLSYVLQESSF